MSERGRSYGGSEAGEAASQSIPLLQAVQRETETRGDAVQVLALLVEAQETLLGQDVLARVRGMLESLMAQLRDPTDAGSAHPQELSFALGRDAELLTFLHALAIECRVGDRLRQNSGIDPLSSPRIEGWLAGSDGELADLGLLALAAQARFCAQSMRMELPLPELPAEIFDRIMTIAAECGAPALAEEWRSRFDEGQGRLTKLTRLATAARGTGPDIAASGLALFLTEVSLASDIPRAALALSSGTHDLAILTLALRAAGLNRQEIGRQAAILAPASTPFDGLDTLEEEEARAIAASMASGEGAR